MIFGAALFALLAQAAAPAAPARPAPQPLTKALIQTQVKAAFDRLDTNKDGSVDQAEAQRGMNNVLAAIEKQRSDRATALFTRLDTNKDGSLSRAEFDSILPKRKAPSGIPYMNNDTNKDGKVSLSEANAKAMADFDRLDKDKNGVISVQEARAGQAQAQPTGR